MAGTEAAAAPPGTEAAYESPLNQSLGIDLEGGSYVASLESGPRSTLVYGEGAMCQPGDLALPPDRGDRPDGAEGDRLHLDDFRLYTGERMRTGQNIVGPDGEEQDWVYELLGRFRGQQNLAADHDMQAEVARLQAAAGGGRIGYETMNRITAAAGWADTALTAPVIETINRLTGSDVDPAVVGVTGSQLLWKLGGYDVPGSGGGQDE